MGKEKEMDDKKVISITVDWGTRCEGDEGFFEDGYNTIQVGSNNVGRIDYHTPQGEGDKHYCDVMYNDGLVERYFNMILITLYPTNK